jgi:DNA polymerase/3'-5' exonuclease PolX
MNKDLISNFQVLADYNNKIGEVHRTRAYKTVISILKNFPDKITNINQVKGIPNIGKKSLSKITEYLETGQIKEAIKAREKLSEYIKPKTEKEQVKDLFTSIWGIGDAKATELYNIGLRTLSDLRKNKHLLTENQRIGLHYYKDLIKPVPRDYIDVLKLGIMFILTYTFGENSYKMEVCGSYRRGEPVSGDMDILLTSTKFTLKQAVKVLEEWDVVVEILGIRDEKLMAIAHCPHGNWHYIRLDLEFLPENEWGSGLLYFTGSKDFGVRTRATAKRQGYRLNQHGLFKDGKRIPVYTEKEILEYIGLKYVPPENR